MCCGIVDIKFKQIYQHCSMILLGWSLGAKVELFRYRGSGEVSIALGRSGTATEQGSPLQHPGSCMSHHSRIDSICQSERVDIDLQID